MERNTLFVDWKNQYCQNDYTTQGNLQIKCNPYQITSGIFHRNRTKSLKICMETQKTLNSLSNFEKEKLNWNSPMLQWLRFHPSTTGDTGLISTWRTKILHATWPKKEGGGAGSGAEGIKCIDLRLYYKVIIIKTA